MSVLFSELLVPGWAEGPAAKVGVGVTADSAFNLPCHTAEPETFFSDNPAAIAIAKALCGGCPLAAQCLEGAISRAEPCGVWGGELFDEGKIITAKRKAGRPRLTPSLQDGSMSEMELAS